jgi:hypothetical protein
MYMTIAAITVWLLGAIYVAKNTSLAVNGLIATAEIIASFALVVLGFSPLRHNTMRKYIFVKTYLCSRWLFM